MGDRRVNLIRSVGLRGINRMSLQAEWGPIWAVQRVLIQQYWQLDGRATRAEYWWFLAAYIGVSLTSGRA